MVARVATWVRCEGSVPASITAAGVSRDFPIRIKRPTNRREMSDSHVNDQRTGKPRPGPTSPAGCARVGFRVAVTGHECDGRRRPAVRDGDAGVRRHAEPRGHARHDLERYPRCA